MSPRRPQASVDHRWRPTAIADAAAWLRWCLTVLDGCADDVCVGSPSDCRGWSSEPTGRQRWALAARLRAAGDALQQLCVQLQGAAHQLEMAQRAGRSGAQHELDVHRLDAQLADQAARVLALVAAQSAGCADGAGALSRSAPGRSEP